MQYLWSCIPVTLKLLLIMYFMCGNLSKKTQLIQMLVNLSKDKNPTGLLGTKGMQYYRSKSNKVYYYFFFLHGDSISWPLAPLAEEYAHKTTAPHNKVYFFHSFYLHCGPYGTANLYRLYHSQQYQPRYRPWGTAPCPSLLLPVVMLTVQPLWHCP